MHQQTTLPYAACDSTPFARRLFAGLAIGVCGLAFLLSCPTDAGANDKKPGKMPHFEKIEKVVAHTLSEENIQPGFLISQGNVTAVLQELARRGWKVRDGKKIIKSALPDDNYLVKRLARSDADKFEQQIAQLPDGYDRLDRLSRMPYGHNTIDALVRGPDGYKMIQYMTTTSGGANLGRQLEEAPTGKDFNEPTGKIYTPAQLIARLKVSYDEEIKRRKQLASNKT